MYWRMLCDQSQQNSKPIWYLAIEIKARNSSLQCLQWARRARAQGPQASGGPQTADALIFSSHEISVTAVFMDFGNLSRSPISQFDMSDPDWDLLAHGWSNCRRLFNDLRTSF